MKREKRFFKIAAMVLSVAMVFAMAGCGKSSQKTEGIGIHHVVIEVENYGKIEVELDGDTAPITVQNFMDLAKSGFYDGLTFHRVLSGFMIQGGDPKGDGTGGSTAIKGEFTANGVTNNISHKRGVISMARLSNNNNSGSSQFFIMHVDYTSLDGQYAAFGHVTSGMEVVDAIVENTAAYGDKNGVIADASKRAVIKTITVID